MGVYDVTADIAAYWGGKLPPSLAWPVIGAVFALGLEYTYRRADHFPLVAVIPALVVTLAIYQTLHIKGLTYLTAMAYFGIATVIVRGVVSHFALHEPLVRGNLAAFLLMLSAGILGRFWR